MTERDMPTYVIDASVVTKWHLDDEDNVDDATRLLDAFRDGAITLIAPMHVTSEVPSAIRNALRTRRLTASQAESAINRFLQWELSTTPDHALVIPAFHASLRFGCSFYDGLYVALAEATGLPLVHADARLRNALRDRFPLAIWIGDWHPSTVG